MLEALAERGVSMVAMRCAGFNNVDLEAAADLGMTVARVPAYSPYAVAEHTVALMLALNRRIPRAASGYARATSRSTDCSASTCAHGASGSSARAGSGRSSRGSCGASAARCVRYDPFPADDVRDLGVRYVDLDTLLGECDVVTLHCPLTPDTHHILDADAFAKMQARRDAGQHLPRRAGGRARRWSMRSSRARWAAVALDVYEEEGDLFFEDLSDTIIDDDVFARLLTFPNVLITAHQAFFTAEALQAIADDDDRQPLRLPRVGAAAPS